MSNIQKFLDNPYIPFRQPSVQDKLHWLPDDVYLKLVYRARMGHKLDLKNPTGFNAKLQWLKLHDRNPLYTTLVDKCLVKDWVAARIGAEHVTQTYEVWESAADIDISGLPDRFVLKTNNDSGGVSICRDKDAFDLDAARRKIDEHLHTNYYWRTREWPYKDVKPLVFAEEYLEPDELGGDLNDYKLFRFTDGWLVTLAMTDRFTGGALSKTFFDDEWRALPMSEGGHPTRPDLVRPENFEQMKAIADKLGEGFPFVRIDFYESGGGLYFGEMTFYPNSGFERFEPAEWDERLGSWIELPESAGGGGSLCLTLR